MLRRNDKHECKICACNFKPLHSFSLSVYGLANTILLTTSTTLVLSFSRALHSNATGKRNTCLLLFVQSPQQKKIKKSSSQHFSKSVFIMLLSLSHILNTFFNFSFLFQIDLMNETNFELKHMKKCPICINDCHILSNSVHTFTHVQIPTVKLIQWFSESC